MKKVLLFACLLAGVAFASTKKYSITLYAPTMIGGTELKAGDYKFELQNQKIVILNNGKETTEASVKVETGDTKYASTSATFANADGKNKLEQICVGGTNMKLVLD